MFPKDVSFCSVEACGAIMTEHLISIVKPSWPNHSATGNSLERALRVREGAHEAMWCAETVSKAVPGANKYTVFHAEKNWPWTVKPGGSTQKGTVTIETEVSLREKVMKLMHVLMS